MAPTAAPGDKPSMKGSAIGFLNIACMTTPAVAKAEPTSIPMIILGILIDTTIFSSSSSSSLEIDFKIALTTSFGGMFAEPIVGAVTSVAMAKASRTSRNLLFPK